MQATLATTEGLERKLTVTVPSKNIDDKYQAKVKEVSTKAKIDGFRPGKVPSSVIEKNYGDSIRHEVIDELMRENLFKAMQEQKVQPAGQPTITSLKADKGQDLEFEATFEVYPEVDVKDLSGETVEKISSELTDKDIDSVLEKLRTQHADWVEVDRASKKDDQVTIDFDGTANGEAIEGGKADNVPLVLGSNTMIPGFEDGIMGMKAGDEKDIEVTFPKEYHEQKLAGQKAVFKIKVHKVSEPKLPELDDAFAEKLGVKDGGLKKLKDDMKKHMSSELENTVKAKNKDAVFEKLVEKNSVDLPKALVESEMEHMHKASHQHQGHDHDHPLSDEERKMLQTPAERRVKLGLLIAELVKKLELKADPAKTKEIVESMAGNYENPEEFVKWYFSDQQRVAQIEAVALEDQVVEKLLESAKVTEKALSYEEAIGR